MRRTWTRTLPLILLAVACRKSNRSATDSPEAAFERLRLAVVLNDAGRLYDALDIETRWAVETVWKYQREMAGLVAGFPADARTREQRRTEPGGSATDPRIFFVAWAEGAGPFAELGGGESGLGLFARVERTAPDQALASTTTGVRVPLRKGSDQRWGYAGLAEPFFQWRNVAANDLSRLRENAAAYRKSPPDPR